ncbi:MAG: PspC domain-containing protein [Chloroflexales bacterium]|nr:PspC domain-containing protein [Chloroflexales bacterium]
METQFVRSSNDRMISGVCGGLARYFGVDSAIVRIIFLASVLFFGLSPLVYVILWIIMPREAAPTTAVPTTTAQYTLPATPAQDPTGEWKYDPYTGMPVKK